MRALIILMIILLGYVSAVSARDTAAGAAKAETSSPRTPSADKSSAPANV